MNTTSLVPDAVIALDCPACDGTLLVAESELDGDVRCESCLVAFSVFEPVGSVRALEMLAA